MMTTTMRRRELFSWSCKMRPVEQESGSSVALSFGQRENLNDFRAASSAPLKLTKRSESRRMLPLGRKSSRILTSSLLLLVVVASLSVLNLVATSSRLDNHQLDAESDMGTNKSPAGAAANAASGSKSPDRQASGRSSSRSKRSPTSQRPVTLYNPHLIAYHPQSTAKGDRLTLKNGCPIGDKFNSLLVGPTGPNLLADTVFIEETAHLNRERIPERVAHAKGAAAYGEFVVTNTDITKYSRAGLFSNKGKSTPVVVRFSHVAGESGVADTLRDVRGFAVKFFTESGNWDLVGNNFPVFFIRDPINFASFLHTQKRNPKTHLKDPDAFWDFISANPESLHATTMLFSERGLPDGFRHMHGYGVHTFKLVNERGQAFYAKFHWICNQSIRNLEPSMADIITGLDPDYSLRDLQTNIDNSNYPNWTLKFQVMSIEDANKAGFNVLDATKTWPTAQFPLQEIGIMKLDQNPDNYFAQVEQLAFSPSNMIPGIEASPDKLLMGRMFSYPDAARYRLGANYADLPCNKPKCPVMTPTYCDGLHSTSNMPGSVPNYVPSSKLQNLKLYDAKLVEHAQEFSDRIGRFDLSKDDNYSQPRALVTKVLSAESRHKLAHSIAAHLVGVTNRDIITRALRHFAQVDLNLSKSIEEAMEKTKQAPRLLP